MATDFDALIEAFRQERARGVFFPPAFRGKLSLEEAYRVQLALVARRVAEGDPQIGWKVGLTAPAIQRQFGVHEPVFGCLLASGAAESGHVFPYHRLIGPGFENEVCLRLRRDLTTAELGADRGPEEPDLEVVRLAVESCFPALEIIETRGDFTAELASALADNAQQKAFVLGPASPLEGTLDLAGIGVRVEVNGREVARGRGDAVLGNPLRSVAWLARRLARFGRALKAGDLIMTGSFTRQFSVGPGDRIAAHFDRLGTVEASFA